MTLKTGFVIAGFVGALCLSTGELARAAGVTTINAISQYNISSYIAATFCGAFPAYDATTVDSSCKTNVSTKLAALNTAYCNCAKATITPTNFQAFFQSCASANPSANVGQLNTCMQGKQDTFCKTTNPDTASAQTAYNTALTSCQNAKKCTDFVSKLAPNYTAFVNAKTSYQTDVDAINTANTFVTTNTNLSTTKSALTTAQANLAAAQKAVADAQAKYDAANGAYAFIKAAQSSGVTNCAADAPLVTSAWNTFSSSRASVTAFNSTYSCAVPSPYNTYAAFVPSCPAAK